MLFFQLYPFNLPQEINMIERQEPIELTRVSSVFKDRMEKNKDEVSDFDEESKIWDRPPVKVYSPFE